jgi:hypothetical protein
MPPSPFTQPYQVKPEDKDFLTLAANLQMNYQDLRAANPYVQSLSQGQYVNVPAPNAGLVANVTQHQQAIQQANMVPLPAPSATSGQGLTWIQRAAAMRSTGNPSVPEPAGNITVPPSAAYNAYGPNRGRNASNPSTSNRITGRGMGIDPRLYQAYKDLAEQIENGEAPGVVPASNLGLLGATPQSMVAAGYVLDPKTGNYVAPGSAGRPAGAVTDPLAGQPGHYYVDEKTAPLVGQIITLADGRKRRLLTDKNGRLYYGKQGVNRRARARRQERLARLQAGVVPSPENRDAPMTALNVILAS